MEDFIIKKTMENDLSISDKEWERAFEGRVETLNWSEFPYIPPTTVKALHNDEGIFVKFCSREDEIITDVSEINGDVYKDSACEFFVKPSDTDDKYFNFEINAKGIPLIGVGTGRGAKRIRIPDLDISVFRIESKIMEKSFIIKFFVPYSFMEKYVDKVDKKQMMGNFQKCCEVSSKPHFNSYYKIGTEKPDFHAPQFFGKIVLE